MVFSPDQNISFVYQAFSNQKALCLSILNVIEGKIY